MAVPPEARGGRRAAAAVLAWCLLLGVVLWLRPPAGDDAYHHAVLSVEQVKAWRSGETWPRFHPDWNGGTGSFAPSLYAPLVLALQGLACAVAGEGSRAVGWTLAGGLAVGALLLLLALGARGMRGGWAWAAAAYPLAAVLARATTTEVWALAFLGPALVLALPPGPVGRREGLLLALAVAALSGCQVGGVLMLAWVLAAAWAAAGLPRWREGLRTAGWVAGGVLLGGALWWPVLREGEGLAREALLAGQYDWRARHVLAVAANRELGPLLVVVFAGLAGLLVLGFLHRRFAREPGEGMGPPLAGLAGALFLATPLSAPLWRALPAMAGLQFPWRFLGPATVLGVVLAGRLQGAWRRGGLLLLLAPAALIPVAVDGGTPRLEPGLPGNELARRAAIRYGLAPVLPSMPGFWAPGFHPLASLEVLRGQGARVGGGEGPLPRDLAVESEEAGEVLLPVQWWPWLRVRAGDRVVPFRNVRGLVAVDLPAGEWRLRVEESGSPGRREGGWMSLAGALLLGALFGARRG